MADFLTGAIIFLTGVCAGFLVAAACLVGARADEPDDFDGGFTANNPPPPVRTVIWSRDVVNNDDR